MTENEIRTMMLIADRLEGEINRMCVTKELSEFNTMYSYAKKNLEMLSNIIFNAKFLPFPEVYTEEKIEVQAEIKPIDYQDCSNAMLRMWIDNVVTDGEYNRIMGKLNAFWRAEHD